MHLKSDIPRNVLHEDFSNEARSRNVLGMELRVLKMVSMGTEAGIPMKQHQPMHSMHKHPSGTKEQPLHHNSSLVFI
jgi:hypothetical protein